MNKLNQDYEKSILVLVYIFISNKMFRMIVLKADGK